MIQGLLKYRGFTLIEALLATVVGSLVVISAIAAMAGITNSRRVIYYSSDITGSARYAMDKIRDDLASVYRSDSTADGVLLSPTARPDRSGAGGLRLYIVSDKKLRRNAPEGDIYEVEYTVQYHSRNERWFLSRRCAAVTDIATGAAGGIVVEIADGVVGLDLQYFDGHIWHDSLPVGRSTLAVRAGLTFDSRDAGYPPIYVSQEISLANISLNQTSYDETKNSEVDITIGNQTQPSPKFP